MLPFAQRSAARHGAKSNGAGRVLRSGRMRRGWQISFAGLQHRARIQPVGHQRVYGNMGDKTASSVYDFEAVDIRGQKKALSAYSGKVLLIANVATQCGLTKNNYEQLSDFVTKYYDQGLRILLFPCNQFGKQEPGEAGEIDAFACHYNAKFDMFGKVLVNSKDAHPLFKYLKAECKGFLVDAIKWNFTKFLVDRHGKPVARFGPTEEPVSFEKRVQAALEQP